MCKNKYRKNKPETSKIVYLKGEGRIGVKRMGNGCGKKGWGGSHFSEYSSCYSSDLSNIPKNESKQEERKIKKEREREKEIDQIVRETQNGVKNK